MFTGLIEAVGSVVEVGSRRGATRLTIRSPLVLDAMELGDSVAVDGVCLTVAAMRGDRFSADAVVETVSCTTLGGLRAGRAVNLERSLRMGDRLGGHLVQGHVDGVAPVISRRAASGDYRLRFGLIPELRKYLAQKGSVALQGVSLTVSALGADWFEVALVPVTLSATTLGKLRVGDEVNVEVDLLARYLERLMTDEAGWGTTP